ncbi:MAG: hypothetical protein ACKOT0_11360 [bacterium]
MAPSSSGEAAPDIAAALLDTAFATVALHQRLTLDELAGGTRDRDFPARSMQTPGWFSAAAARTSRLAEMAPELAATPADHGRLDLIHMYAPELDTVEVDEPLPSVAPAVPAAVDSDARRRLLAELRDIDT